MNPLICFVHIPRTAGTSFLEAIRKDFGSRALFVKELNAKVKTIAALVDQADEEIEIVAGHQTYGLHRHIERPVHYATLLRNPRERYLSEYALRLDPLKWIPSQTRLGQDSETSYFDAIGKDFIVRAKKLNSWSNKQASWLAGFAADEKKLNEHELILKAKSNLSTFKFVGITERLKESQDLFNLIFGTKLRLPDKRYKRSAINIRYDEIDSETRKFIDSRIALDQQVYELGITIFKKKLYEYNAKHSL